MNANIFSLLNGKWKKQWLAYSESNMYIGLFEDNDKEKALQYAQSNGGYIRLHDTRAEKYCIASCSNGKDSMAMCMRLIKEGAPLNEIVFFNNGMDFDCIISNWERLKLLAESIGIKCTVLTPKMPFLYKMFEKRSRKRVVIPIKDIRGVVGSAVGELRIN